MSITHTTTDMEQLYTVLSMLADGKYHSATTLAGKLGVNRATIRQYIDSLYAYHVNIGETQGKGYRLRQRYDALDEREISRLLEKTPSLPGIQVKVFPVLDSTNDYLLQQQQTRSIHHHVVMAEHQTKGRGRQGKQWISPFGGGLFLSLGLNREQMPNEIPTALISSVAVIRALQPYIPQTIQVKWPNDIMVKGRKLGGILLEVRRKNHGAYGLVLGIGINIHFPDTCQAAIPQPWVDLNRLAPTLPPRNQLAAALITALIQVLASENRPHLLEEWRQYDACRGKTATLTLPDQTIRGIVQGVDDQGRLLLLVAGQMKSFYAGELNIETTV